MKLGKREEEGQKLYRKQTNPKKLKCGLKKGIDWTNGRGSKKKNEGRRKRKKKGTLWLRGKQISLFRCDPMTETETEDR